MTRFPSGAAAIPASPFLALVFAAAPIDVADAGSFQIREGSAAAQGASFAGRTSGDRDVSFALHNPAALRTVENFEASAGVAGIIADGDATADLPISGPPLGLANTDDPNETAIVPSFAMGWRLNEHYVFGVAVDAPFGLATKYDPNFIGAFDGVESELTNITVTPIVTVQPIPDLALAAGLTLSYADARLTSRTATGIAEVEGDDFRLGFTLGALMDLGPRTTVGFAAAYSVSHELEGDITGLGPASGPGSANLDLPTVVSLGVTHGFTDDFRMMAEFEYNGWSSFETIDIFSNNAGGVVSSETQNYDASIMLAIGAEYDVTPEFTIRGGVAWDQTPTNDADRTVRTPDADRIWLSVGASYELTESVGVDLAYSYLDFLDTESTLKRGPNAGTRLTYDESAAHIVSINARYKW